MKKILIEDLHFEHKNWNSELEFQKDEITTFTNRLAEVTKRWTKKEILKEVEHFQNCFLIQEKNIKYINHKIKEHEHLISNISSKANSTDIEKHKQIRNDLQIHTNIYSETKRKYLNFLIRAM